jgi:hypothetical protein
MGQESHPRCLLKEIISQFGIAVSTRSDNGLAFVAKVAKGLAITWKLHMAYHPPEFRESRIYEQGSKIVIGKSMPGVPPMMGSVTSQSLSQD